MKSSADYFGFLFDEGEIVAGLSRVAASKRAGSWKIRLLLSRKGEFQIEALELDAFHAEPSEWTSTEPVNSNDKFLFTRRPSRGLAEGNGFAARL